MSNVRQHLKLERARALLSRLFQAYGVGTCVVVAVTLVLVVEIYRLSDSTLGSAEVSAKLTGVHAVQSYSGSIMQFAAVLADGQVVLFVPPMGTPFHEGSTVVLVKSVSRRGHESFGFKAYAS